MPAQDKISGSPNPSLSPNPSPTAPAGPNDNEESQLNYIEDLNARVPEALRKELAAWGISEAVRQDTWHLRNTHADPARIAQDALRSAAGITSAIGTASAASTKAMQTTGARATTRVRSRATQTAILLSVVSSAVLTALQYSKMQTFDAKRAAADIVASAVLAGLAAATAAALRRFLEGLFERLSKVGVEGILKSVGKVGVKSTAAIGSVVVVGAEVAISLLKWAFYQIAKSAPSISEEVQQYYAHKQATEASIEQTLTNAACGVAGYLLSSVGLAAAATAAGFAAPGMIVTGLACCITTGILHSIAESVQTSKNHSGGWSAWLASVLYFDEQPMMWESHRLDLVEDQITPDLFCPITKALVVEPVRYIGAPGATTTVAHGKVYEREALFRHLRARSADPLTNLPATAAHYRPSPAAKRLAHEVARVFQAERVRVNDGA
ncbi:hypothetical protein OC842_006373 [Tilletia horrida]|uniref:U-box domain-containing protein n=1 Tax=Tilletia horrida TaxID=155126 RepID=A0AAN6JI40_9BASI|nr:hypothetical protein OC842_006373 [Tilletia horrida]